MGQRLPHPKVEQRRGRGELRSRLDDREADLGRAQNDLAAARLLPALPNDEGLLEADRSGIRGLHVAGQQVRDDRIPIGDELELDPLDPGWAEHVGVEAAPLDEAAQLPAVEAIWSQ